MTKDDVIQKMIDDLKRHPNQEDVYMVTGQNSSTYANIVYAIENKTLFGLSLIKNIDKLNEDLIKRNKKPLWNEEM